MGRAEFAQRGGVEKGEERTKEGWYILISPKRLLNAQTCIVFWFLSFKMVCNFII